MSGIKSGKRRKKRRAAILNREVLGLEKQLAEVLSSPISNSKSHQYMASYIKDKILQKRAEIGELSNTSH